MILFNINNEIIRRNDQSKYFKKDWIPLIILFRLSFNRIVCNLEKRHWSQVKEIFNSYFFLFFYDLWVIDILENLSRKGFFDSQNLRDKEVRLYSNNALEILIRFL